MPNSPRHDFWRLLDATQQATQAGRLQEAHGAAEELLDAAATRTPRDRAAAYFAAATVAFRQGSLAVAMRQYTTVLDELERIDVDEGSDDEFPAPWLLRGRAHVLLGEVHYANRDPDSARRSYRSAIREADAAAERRPDSASHALQRATQWRLSLLKRDRDAAREGLVESEESRQTYATLIQQASSGVVRLAAMGRPTLADDLRIDVVIAVVIMASDLHSENAYDLMLEALQPGLEHAEALADKSDDPEVLSMVAQHSMLLAEALMGSERDAEAIPHLERSIALARSIVDHNSTASEMAEFIPLLEARLEAARRSGQD